MDAHTETKLQDLRRRIEHGEYVIDAGAVAEAILRRLTEIEPAPEPVDRSYRSPARTPCRRAPLGRSGRRTAPALAAVGG